MNLKRPIAVAAALVVAFLLVYMAFRVFQEGRDAKAGPASSQTYSSAQRQAYDLLSGATQPVPLALRNRLRQARNETVRSLWLNAARYVPMDSGLWVVNGQNDTCIIQARGGAVSCESRVNMLRKGIALGVVNLGPPPERKAREFIVYGIAPNSVKAVEAQVGEKSQLVPLRNNSYFLRANVPILIKSFKH